MCFIGRHWPAECVASSKASLWLRLQDLKSCYTIPVLEVLEKRRGHRSVYSMHAFVYPVIA